MNRDQECKIVQDLLPLYHDGVCSRESSALVEEHLKTCESCRNLLKMIDADENETAFAQDTRNILKAHEKKERRTAVRAGMVIAGILLIPVIVALILTISGYMDLKTDAVLAVSLLLVAGLTVVPLVSDRRKASKAIVFSAAALILLIFAVQMLFGNGSLLRFVETAFSVIFGLSVVLFPVVVRQADLPGVWKSHRGLIVMSWDTVWFYLMLLSFAMDFHTAAALGIGTVCAAFVWMVFLTARYLPVNRWIRAGVITALCGAWFSAGCRSGWVTIDTGQGNIAGDLAAPVLAAAIAACLVLCAAGILRTVRKKHS